MTGPADNGIDRVQADAAELAELAELRKTFASYGLAIPVPTAANYDVATEGKPGWRFVFTRRWLVFVGAAVLFAASCVAGVAWQWSQWNEITSYNSIVLMNFRAPTTSLASVLPQLDSYRASNQWRPITVTGTYDVAQQFFVRNRTCATLTGFEVLTPLRLANGSEFIIDRGCVSTNSTDSSIPALIPAPPAGAVTVTAHVVASESNQGAIQGDQVESIDVKQIGTRLSSQTYVRAYGLLASQQPAASKSLAPVISGRPLLDTSGQTATIFAMGLYVVVGLVIFAYALREKFRWINRFDPRLWRRELRRIQRAARKRYTDEELEDLLIEHENADVAPALGSAGFSKPGSTAQALPESASDAGRVIQGGSFNWKSDV